MLFSYVQTKIDYITYNKRIFKNEGDDYRDYSEESKKVIASCAAFAVSIKTVLDTPLLTDDGLLTPESETTLENVQESIEKIK